MDPKALAAALKVDPRQVRRILRKLKGTLAAQNRSRRWELTQDEVDAVQIALTPKPEPKVEIKQ